MTATTMIISNIIIHRMRVLLLVNSIEAIFENSLDGIRQSSICEQISWIFSNDMCWTHWSVHLSFYFSRFSIVVKGHDVANLEASKEWPINSINTLENANSYRHMYDFIHVVLPLLCACVRVYDRDKISLIKIGVHLKNHHSFWHYVYWHIGIWLLVSDGMVKAILPGNIGWFSLFTFHFEIPSQNKELENWFHVVLLLWKVGPFIHSFNRCDWTQTRSHTFFDW